MTKPDLTLLHDVVALKVLPALALASEALSSAQVRHVVIGGLAVGANRHPRATQGRYRSQQVAAFGGASAAAAALPPLCSRMFREVTRDRVREGVESRVEVNLSRNRWISGRTRIFVFPASTDMVTRDNAPLDQTTRTN
jgi:hypothetical protein